MCLSIFFSFFPSFLNPLFFRSLTFVHVRSTVPDPTTWPTLQATVQTDPNTLPQSPLIDPLSGASSGLQVITAIEVRKGKWKRKAQRVGEHKLEKVDN